MALTYVPPSQFDGGPAVVERASIDQLLEVLEETAAQIRNAFQTRVLDELPAISPAELAEVWEVSDRKAALDRIEVLIEQL